MLSNTIAGNVKNTQQWERVYFNFRLPNGMANESKTPVLRVNKNRDYDVFVFLQSVVAVHVADFLKTLPADFKESIDFFNKNKSFLGEVDLYSYVQPCALLFCPDDIRVSIQKNAVSVYDQSFCVGDPSMYENLLIYYVSRFFKDCLVRTQGGALTFDIFYQGKIYTLKLVLRY